LKRWKRLSTSVFVLGITLLLAFVSGCDDNPVEPGTSCDPSVATKMIITNPLAPAPGDTTMLTIQAEGTGCGNWAAYRWTAEGGELLQTQGITVQWVAPMDYGAYQIRCVATLTGAKSDTSRALVMVREFEYLLTGKKASLNPRFMGSDFYFIAEEGAVGPRSNDFRGYAVYSLAGTRVSKITDTGNATDDGAYEFDFAGSTEAIYGSFIVAYYSGLRLQRMNVWRFPTRFGTPVDASSDAGGTGILRKNQHRYPKTNMIGDKAVWKYQFAGASADGTKDLFNIVFWDEADGAGNWKTITTSHDSATVIIGPDTITQHRYFSNILPMFTPDESNILYFVDTTGVFEPCLIPMSGGEPDTLQRRALMVDQRMGIFEQAGVEISEKTVFEWNPSSNFLSFIATGNIVFFDYESETVVKISDLTKVTEFAWAPDGSQLAAVNEEGVCLVSAGGAVAPDPVFVRERPTDDIIGITWNNDLAEPKLAFRLVRKGKSEIDSWSSIIVVDLTSGLWAYASPTVQWHSSREPEQISYIWKRLVFSADDTGIYAPFPVLDDVNYPGKDVILVYSHE